MSPTEIDVANRCDGPGEEFLTPPEAHQATYPASPVGHLFASTSAASSLPPAAQQARSRTESRTRLRTKTPAQDCDPDVECRKVVTRAKQGSGTSVPVRYEEHDLAPVEIAAPILAPISAPTSDCRTEVSTAGRPSLASSVRDAGAPAPCFGSSAFQHDLGPPPPQPVVLLTQPSPDTNGDMVNCVDELGAAACVAIGAQQAAALPEQVDHVVPEPPQAAQGDLDPLMAASVDEQDILSIDGSPLSSGEGESEAPLISRGSATAAPQRG